MSRPIFTIVIATAMHDKQRHRFVSDSNTRSTDDNGGIRNNYKFIRSDLEEK